MIKRFGVKTSFAVQASRMSRVLMCDPPSGWKYGFPKPVPEDLTSTLAWLVSEGYPQSEIDACGDHFYCRYYETEVEQNVKS